MNIRRPLTILLACLSILIIPGRLRAQEKQKIPFRDSLDGAVDFSSFLASAYGFIPFMMPITEPALGYGLAGGPIFIHRDIAALNRGEPSPPGMSVAGGMYTENGSWGVLHHLRSCLEPSLMLL
jgi:hypothetical protein